MAKCFRGYGDDAALSVHRIITQRGLGFWVWGSKHPTNLVPVWEYNNLNGFWCPKLLFVDLDPWGNTGMSCQGLCQVVESNRG